MKTPILDIRSLRHARVHSASVNPLHASGESLYLVGAAAALVSVLLVLIDIFMSIGLSQGEVAPGTRTAIDWYVLLQNHVVYGLRDLGLLNILNSLLGIPLFLTLYMVHRRTGNAYALLAVVLFLFGGAIYIANNPALPLLVLSGKYAAATTDAQRAILAAAGEALLARGADFTLGSLSGFLLLSIAQIVISCVMLRGSIFSSTTGYIGIVGFTCLLIFTIWTTLLPNSFDVAMWLAMPGGLLAMAWNILVAQKLFRLGREA